jgi:hypothetical protein
LDAIAKTNNLISNICLCFDLPEESARNKVLQMLTVTSVFGSEGRSVVLAGLDHFAANSVNSSRESRFKPIVDALAATADTDLKLDAITFINALLNSPVLEDRVALRNELMDLGIVERVDQLNAWAKRKQTSLQANGDTIKEDDEEKDGEGDEDKDTNKDDDGDTLERCQELIDQCDEFTLMMTNDSSDTRMALVDLGDPDSVFEFLRTSAQTDGTTSHLLAVLHLLMTIPVDRRVSIPLWTNVQYIVHLATLQQGQLTFDELKNKLSERHSEDEHEHIQRLSRAEDEIAKLKIQMEDAKRQTVRHLIHLFCLLAFFG